MKTKELPPDDNQLAAFGTWVMIISAVLMLMLLMLSQ